MADTSSAILFIIGYEESWYRDLSMVSMKYAILRVRMSLCLCLCLMFMLKFLCASENQALQYNHTVTEHRSPTIKREQFAIDKQSTSKPRLLLSRFID